MLPPSPTAVPPEGTAEPPTSTPEPTATSTVVPAATPTAAPTPEPTPLGIHTKVGDFGFTLTVDGDVFVTASGWLKADADETQG